MRNRERRSRAAERILIAPPFADPTQPYLSLPVLKGHLRAEGLDARVIDLNVEAAHYLFERETLTALVRRFAARYGELNRAATLDFEEQLEYQAFARIRGEVEALLDADPFPLDVFRDGDLFFDPACYARARRQTEVLFDALSALSYPFCFDFNRAAHAVLPWSFAGLEEYVAGDRSPLAPFYRRIFDAPGDGDELAAEGSTIDLATVDFIGISIVFPSQIPEGFFLCRFLKARAPHAFIALGGPCIHQAVVHMDEARRRRVFDFVDGVGLYEGEETVVQLFRRLPELRAARSPAERTALLVEVPNLLFLDGAEGATRQGREHVLDLRTANPPDYSDLALDLYLAPSRTLLYAPTRGCYWNRCSFCYYGLSQNATAKYREVPPERAAADLARLSKRHGVRNFYISCDVLSPSYAVRFAEAILARGLKIKWSSDLKIDKFFTPERCELLYRAGLRSAAFGIESGSDRILELMRKGCDRATMTAVNRAFHAAGVATEWMTFTQHPGESAEEGLRTVDWIEAESQAVDLFIVGEFGLQPGSHIALEPERYGVKAITFAEEDDFHLYALYEEVNPSSDPRDGERVDRAIATLAARYALNHYPWAGAISTHHSFLYFVRFGQRAFLLPTVRAAAQFAGSAGERENRPAPALRVLREPHRFSLAAISRAERSFLDSFLRGALKERGAGRRREQISLAPISRATFRAAAAAVAPLAASRG